MHSTTSKFRLRKFVLYQEILAQQNDVDIARQKLRELEHRTRRIRLQSDACSGALSNYHARLCSDLNSEYREQIHELGGQAVKLEERKNGLGEQLVCHETSISNYLEGLRKNQKVDFAMRQAQLKEAALTGDAELMALRSAVEGEDD